MTSDKETTLLIEALKAALAEPGEQRLFRSGKLNGLFPNRGEASLAAAERAVRDGLLEIVRTESKGKLPTEWVRLTPSGVAVLHAHESPRAVLEELHRSLKTSQSGVPIWLEGMQAELTAIGTRLETEMRRMLDRLDGLTTRVEEALRRTGGGGPALANGVADTVPWAADVLAYLDQRRDSGRAGNCPLPELFAAVRYRHPTLSVPAFHDGLRRLTDYHAITLVPFTGPVEELTEPEHALLDGTTVLYYASRQRSYPATNELG